MLMQEPIRSSQLDLLGIHPKIYNTNEWVPRIPASVLCRGMACSSLPSLNQQLPSLSSAFCSRKPQPDTVESDHLITEISHGKVCVIMKLPNIAAPALMPSPHILPSSFGLEATPRTPRQGTKRHVKVSSKSLNRDFKRRTTASLPPSSELLPSGRTREETEAGPAPKGTKRSINSSPLSPTRYKRRNTEDLDNDQGNFHTAKPPVKQQRVTEYVPSARSKASLPVSSTPAHNDTPDATQASQQPRCPTPDREIQVPASPSPVVYSLVSYNLGPEIRESSPGNAQRILLK